jgi:hypothetical protein
MRIALHIKERLAYGKGGGEHWGKRHGEMFHSREVDMSGNNRPYASRQKRRVHKSPDLADAARHR